jgi:undecaprenyl-diphosphatase
MTNLQAIVMAVLQGVTELFPVSSLGHAVILPRLLHWAIDQKSPDFLPYLVVMHLGTAIALLLYFWRDWWAFILSIVGAASANTRTDRRILLLVILATIPAVVVGAVLRKLLGDAFATPLLAAAFLVVNGFILFGGEKLGSSAGGTLDQLNWKGALAIGVAQCLALIPGISRSGSTIVAGVIAGLQHKDSARFSFLMAPPIMLGATVHEAPELLRQNATLGGAALLSGVVAGVVAFISIAVLMRYFRSHEFEALNPFAWYCWIAGVLSFGWIALT